MLGMMNSHWLLILLYIGGMTAVIIYPLLWTVGASFNPGNSLVSTSIIPANPTLDHYKELFAGKESLQYGQWYINSLKISIFTMIVSWIYKLTMQSSQYSLAAALTILLSVFVISIALWQFRRTNSFKEGA
ncbi:hypothetical protein DT075_04850 [Bacillus licheniformis]|nr:hypothetical protein DT075_04850 [Bacillus licheniformis]